MPHDRFSKLENLFPQKKPIFLRAKCFPQQALQKEPTFNHFDWLKKDIDRLFEDVKQKMYTVQARIQKLPCVEMVHLSAKEGMFNIQVKTKNHCFSSCLDISDIINYGIDGLVSCIKNCIEIGNEKWSSDADNLIHHVALKDYERENIDGHGED